MKYMPQICKDTRTCAVVNLVKSGIKSHNFPNLSMGVKNLEHVYHVDIAGLIDIFHAKLNKTVVINNKAAAINSMNNFN